MEDGKSCKNHLISDTLCGSWELEVEVACDNHRYLVIVVHLFILDCRFGKCYATLKFNL